MEALVGAVAEDGDGGPGAGQRAAKPHHVLILGGGFAGVATTLRLERKLRADPGVRITLVSDENFFLFTPMLHEVASGSIETRHIAVPVRRLRGRRRFEFIQDQVQAVDLERRVVETSLGPMSYDTLVLALGSVTDPGTIAGVGENAFDLKTLHDGVLLRNHVIKMFEEVAARGADTVGRLTFAVVGGGTNGVQTVAELNDLVRRWLPREYRRVNHSEIRVLLLQDEARLLPELDPKLGTVARKVLERRGVEVHTETLVSDLDGAGLELDGSTRIPCRTVIWTPGIVANPVAAALPVDKDELGRVHVNEFFQLPEYPEVYALGDNAHIVDTGTGKTQPPTAHVAVRQPRAVAANIVADLRGGPKRTYRYWHVGQMIALGSRSAAADLLGVGVHGFLVRLLWQSAYASLMPGRYNQVRVLTDWLLGLVFRRDTTLLRWEW